MKSNSASSDLINQSSLVWFIGLIARAKRFVVLSSLITFFLSAVVAFLLPHYYASTVTVLPPRETNVLGSLGSLGSALRDFAPIRSIGGLGARGGQYNYLSILDSRSSKEALISRFDLMRVYKIADSSIEKTIKVLDSNVEVDVAEEGHINITVFDEDPKRAAEMANYYVDVLNEVNTELNYQGSSKYREFLEKGVNEAKDSLRTYEEMYKEFQKRSGFIAMPDDVQSGAKALAQLYSEKALKEVEIQFLSQVVSSENPELQRKRLEYQVLNQKLSNIPDLGLEQWRIYRNLLIQSRILEVLIPIYEQARLEEKKETPSVAILDRAVPAERKAKPKRLLIMFFSTFSAALISLIFFAVRERLQVFRKESPESYQILQSIFSLRMKR